MKKLIQSLILFFLFNSTCIYSENIANEIKDSGSVSNKKEAKGIFEAGIGFEDDDIDKYKLNFIYSFPINSNLSWGIGTGLHIYNQKYFFIPLFANFRADLFSNKTSPYFSLNTGYYLYSNQSGHGVLFNPTIGVSFFKSRGKSLDIGIGYDMLFTDRIYFSPIGDFLRNGILSLNIGFSF